MFFETTIEDEEPYESLLQTDEIATCEQKHENFTMWTVLFNV